MKIKVIIRIIVLTIVVPFVFLSASPAPITQEEADEIVMEYISREVQLYSVFSKEDIQVGATITTFTGEALELDYPCRVYYVSYTGETDNNVGYYLVVNESNGNVLEINAKNDAGPEDLAEWRMVLDMTAIDFNNIQNLYEQPLPVIQKCVQGRWKLDTLFGGITGFYPVDDLGIFIEINGNKWYGEEFQWKKHTAQWPNGNSFKTYVIQGIDEPSPWVFCASIKNDSLAVGYPSFYVFPTPCYDCYTGELWIRTK